MAIVHELIERFDAHLKAEQFYSGGWRCVSEGVGAGLFRSVNAGAVC